jgi:hypothetical protein
MLAIVTNSTSNGLPTATSYSSVSPTGMIVTIDEARHDRHALRIEHLRAFAGQRGNLHVRADCNEAPAAYREGLGPRQARIHGVDVGVANDQVLIARPCDRRTQAAGQGSGGDDAQRRQPRNSRRLQVRSFIFRCLPGSH